ncbi:very short patch repair endonuclease [Plantibacter flavus]|uniref:very short patch repair endonuclease n=1 Tax=Plantibacter flavus TaxID=150123 RepID=UPI0022861D60|nr:very short patch repair endonuclease [Plantibacter flavus]
MQPAPDRPSAKTSSRMRSVRRSDTGAELAVRRELFARGRRYRIDLSPVRGMRSRADIVFTKHRLAVYIDGCFWHKCPLHASLPRSNSAWWAEKLAANETRDRRVDRELAAAGWRVLRAWEHEPPVDVADRIDAELSRSVGPVF